jgi:hypothetical protein
MGEESKRNSPGKESRMHLQNARLRAARFAVRYLVRLWRKTSRLEQSNENRMTPIHSLSTFASHLREFIRTSMPPESLDADPAMMAEERFNELALCLFQLQFDAVMPYQRFCVARGHQPNQVGHWAQIPALPTSAFKEHAVTCLPPSERTFVFHSSGTSAHQPSSHYHNGESLQMYEASLLPWFRLHLLTRPRASSSSRWRFLSLTPPPASAPHSSLVHMFDVVRREFGTCDSLFAGEVEPEGWRINLPMAFGTFREAMEKAEPLVLLGTAFSYVHLLDAMRERGLKVELPRDSRVLETGGYKGRSRVLPRAELHDAIAQQLGINPTHIISEYGMSELSSQAYDRSLRVALPQTSERIEGARAFQFPPWARVQLISPETGQVAGEGEPGLIRVFDLANVFSVLAIQTQDLGIRRGARFELIGRAGFSEPRGCSLMAA